MKILLLCVLVLGLATPVLGLESRAYQIKEDYGTAPLWEYALQYYYFIPCPTYAWFWAVTGWTPGDILGARFWLGDQGTGGWPPCDPLNCHTLEMIRILDFAGYGTVYVGWYTFEMDVYCCTGTENPLLHLWNSGHLESHFGWNYIEIAPPLCLYPCHYFDPEFNCRIIVTATMTGNYEGYPAWGFDNISSAVEDGCVMHDIGCMPVVYPRTCFTGPGTPEVHSGYVGTFPFENWPPVCLCDRGDTTADCTQYGYIDLAWRIYLMCEGPSAGQPSTWGSIKSMYR